MNNDLTEVKKLINYVTVEPLVYDHNQNHIGMVAREGFVYFALLQ